MKQYQLNMKQEGWLSNEFIHLLSKVAATRVYWEGETIYRQEEKASWCYYLKKGKVRIFVASEGGMEKTLAVYKEPCLFGEAAFFDGHPRTTTAMAMKETEVLVISKENMLQCFKQEPDLAWSVMSTLSQTIRMLSKEINQMSFFSARKRLLQFLVESYERGETKILHTQEEIGAILGVSRVTISREVKELKKRGILQVQYGMLNIQKIEALKELLEECDL